MHAGMLERLCPGEDLRNVSDAAETVINDYLVRTNRPTHFRFRTAHALGHSYEDPIASTPFPQPYDRTAAAPASLPAQSGMLLEIHPNLFIPGVGGASIGDTVLVGEVGPEVLTRFPAELSQF